MTSPQARAPARDAGRRVELDPAARDGVAHALRDVIGRTGSWLTPFEGASMEPSIMSGCLLEVESMPERLLLGELLVFVHDVRVGVCCHRVIGLHRDGRALTQGDNVAMPDGLIDPERFVGVVRRYRLGGRWYAARASAARPFVLRRWRHRLVRAVERWTNMLAEQKP